MIFICLFYFNLQSKTQIFIYFNDSFIKIVGFLIYQLIVLTLLETSHLSPLFLFGLLVIDTS